MRGASAATRYQTGGDRRSCPFHPRRAGNDGADDRSRRRPASRLGTAECSSAAAGMRGSSRRLARDVSSPGSGLSIGFAGEISVRPAWLPGGSLVHRGAAPHKRGVRTLRFNLLLQSVYQQFTVDTKNTVGFQVVNKIAYFLTKERQSKEWSARTSSPALLFTEFSTPSVDIRARAFRARAMANDLLPRSG